MSTIPTTTADREKPIGIQGGVCQWYAVQTRGRYEKTVASHLENRDIETCLPLRSERRAWTDRHKQVTLPMFPGYVFVHVPFVQLRIIVLQTPGVRDFVMFQGHAAPITQKEIDDIRLIMEQKVQCLPHPYLRVGHRVRIHGGVLEGLEGTLSQTSKHTLVVSIEPMERSIAVSVDGYEIETISPSTFSDATSRS